MTHRGVVKSVYQFMKRHSGYLEVIAGPMFSGKTEELIRQVKRAAIGKKRVQVFKHKVDTRYGNDNKVHSHAGVSFESDLVARASEIIKKLDPKTEIIAIDEAQWFGEELISIIETLLKMGKRVLVAGLALTFDRQPFVPMPTLMSIADRVTKLSAICTVCGDEAIYHKRVTKKGPKVSPLKADPGFVSKLDLSVFQARCRIHFTRP